MLINLIKIILTIVVLIAIAMTVLFVIKGRASKTGEAIGLQDGVLAACPGSPNCVSSESGNDESHSISGLSFSGDATTAWQAAAAAVTSTGGKIAKDSGDYLSATYESSLFGFIDDLELRLDAASQMIHVRSASREGHSDLGANRKRVEALRQAIQSN